MLINLFQVHILLNFILIIQLKIKSFNLRIDNSNLYNPFLNLLALFKAKLNKDYICKENYILRLKLKVFFLIINSLL